MYSIDILIQNYFTLTRTPVATEFLYVFTNLFDLTVHSILITLFTVLLILLVIDFRSSLLFLFSIIFGCAVVYVLKMYFNVPRPEGGVMLVFGQSFPSYHATISTIYFVMLMHIFGRYFSSVGRIIFNLVSLAVIFAVAFSRIYLGVHWFSDVFFGIILGVAISQLCILIFKFVIKRPHGTSKNVVK